MNISCTQHLENYIFLQINKDNIDSILFYIALLFEVVLFSKILFFLFLVPYCNKCFMQLMLNVESYLYSVVVFVEPADIDV